MYLDGRGAHTMRRELAVCMEAVVAATSTALALKDDTVAYLKQLGNGVPTECLELSRRERLLLREREQRDFDPRGNTKAAREHDAVDGSAGGAYEMSKPPSACT